MCNCNIFYIYPFEKTNSLELMMVLSFIFHVEAQDSDTDTMPDLSRPVHPNKVVVLVALSILFTLTFLLLAYVRFRRNTSELFHRSNHHLPTFQALTHTRSRLSGIDREVIQTLPFFRFSSHKGSKQGLECTVCLSQFEDTEILRLLPKCKHAFHMNCIDKWLENHSNCPLCRNNVDPLDIKNFTYSFSSKFLRIPSNLSEDTTNLEIFVQREPSHRGSSVSSRFNIGSRFWNLGRSNKEETLIDQEVCANEKHVHKFNHKIVISDVVTRSRWSDLNSSDMLLLNSEMLHDMSSTRFRASNSEKFCESSRFLSTTSFNEDENSFMSMNPAKKRSMSEIAHVPRFIEMNEYNGMKEGMASSENNGREERLRRIWLPIAQRTVKRFSRQERNSRELDHKSMALNV
ncbi:putative RING-H2 finger protein ATL12 [Abrus precatorius]|uniref:RING-type E3 ubiquitin transferase n=1 Tax=Abrus precatorius TaxID=3816 RepID=A0A8B8JLR7_ABRPR|nr:putative RING-H2 finger protein ATL12 [Abrus precatorius]